MQDMETYEITQEDVKKAEAGLDGWLKQFWTDVFEGTKHNRINSDEHKASSEARKR